MTNRLRTTLLTRQKAVEGGYVFPSRYDGHKSTRNNRALEAAFKRSGLTDAQHLLGHAYVKTTENTLHS
jgi:integrase